MTLPPRTRLAKRKHEIKEVRKENQTTTSKKHDKKCLENDANSTEVTLLIRIKSMEEKIDSLEQEKRAAEVVIEDLKNIIKSKEATKVEGIAKEVSKKEVGVQHDTTDIMFCHECEYPADDMYDLGGHMVEFHSEGVVSNEINCHFCDETFSTMDSVMKHRKQAHKDKVKQCIFFVEGKCEYGDTLCWFIHKIDRQIQEATELKCKHCEKTFKTRSTFMKHRKSEHSESVPACKNVLNGAC